MDVTECIQTFLWRGVWYLKFIFVWKDQFMNDPKVLFHTFACNSTTQHDKHRKIHDNAYLVMI